MLFLGLLFACSVGNADTYTSTANITIENYTTDAWYLNGNPTFKQGKITSQNYAVIPAATISGTDITPGTLVINGVGNGPDPDKVGKDAFFDTTINYSDGFKYFSMQTVVNHPRPYTFSVAINSAAYGALLSTEGDDYCTIHIHGPTEWKVNYECDRTLNIRPPAIKKTELVLAGKYTRAALMTWAHEINANLPADFLQCAVKDQGKNYVTYADDAVKHQVTFTFLSQCT